jgi:signal transduction histidine kinase/DNA-binding NarL/FixJ family response regulator
MENSDVALLATTDDSLKAHVTQRLHAEIPNLTLHRVTDSETLLDWLTGGSPDCLVCDRTVPSGSLEEFVTTARGIDMGLPIVVVADGRQLSVRELFDAGLTEYIPRQSVERDDGIERLVVEVERAVSRHSVVDDATRERISEELSEDEDPSVAVEAYLLRQLFEQLPKHLFIKDENAEHIYVSDRSIHDPDAFLGHTDRGINLDLDEHANRAYEDDMHVVETGESIVDKEEYDARHGRWLQTSKVPWYGPEGSVKGLIGLSHEVTEQKRYEQRTTVLDRVLRHNVRNHASVIRGYAKRLRSEHEQIDVPATASRIADSIDALIEITDQIREFESVIERRSADRIDCDLVTTLRRQVEGFELDHPEATVSLSAPEEASVRIHGTLPSAVGELLSLAAENDGCHVELDVEVTDLYCHLRFLDHGGTLPTEDVEAVERETEDAVTHPQGLELWLLRWSVQYSDGVIEVDSDGDATVVEIRLERA